MVDSSYLPNAQVTVEKATASKTDQSNSKQNEWFKISLQLFRTLEEMFDVTTFFTDVDLAVELPTKM